LPLLSPAEISENHTPSTIKALYPAVRYVVDTTTAVVFNPQSSESYKINKLLYCWYYSVFCWKVSIICTFDGFILFYDIVEGKKGDDDLLAELLKDENSVIRNYIDACSNHGEVVGFMGDAGYTDLHDNEYLNEKNVSIICPHRNRKGEIKRFTKDEEVVQHQIVKYRNVIERVNRRLKRNRLLKMKRKANQIDMIYTSWKVAIILHNMFFVPLAKNSPAEETKTEFIQSRKKN
jgi:hypothetical protein